MHKVAILCVDQVAMFELSCAIELFALERPEYRPWYQTEVVYLGDSAVKATGGLSLQAKNIATLAAYKTLIVPSWPVDKTDIAEVIRKQVLRLHARGGRIIAFCSGAFLLGELGLLDHQTATTHWRYADTFKQRFPKVDYRDNVLYTYDEKIACSAGSAAALDLGIEVIRRDFGYEIANEVSRRLVLPAHRQGGQAQFVQTPISKANHALAAVLDWALQNLDQALEINQMAAKACLSRRSFDRHFRLTIGMSPKEWLNRQRLSLAQRLLEKKTLTIDQVAQQSGFQSAMNLRHYFRKYLGISPSHYKNQFTQ